jgi:hypothetical protein
MENKWWAQRSKPLPNQTEAAANSTNTSFRKKARQAQAAKSLRHSASQYSEGTSTSLDEFRMEAETSFGHTPRRT